MIFKEGGRFFIEDLNNIVEIKRDTDVVDAFFAVRGKGSKVVVDEDCMFSAKVIIRNSDAHSILNDKGERINPEKDVYIGKHVWVGYGANVLKGSYITANSIVGTQSVVTGTKLTEEGCVLAGNPAKIVKTGITWDRKRIL